MIPKLFIGTVSQTVIQAAIELSKEENIPLGLISSRNQIDYNGGYVGMTTKDLKSVVSNYNNITLERDHGGVGQSDSKLDDDYISFAVDSLYMNIIHIDPWKKQSNIVDGINYTAYWINNIKSPDVNFEIGTEQAIRPFTISEMDFMLNCIKKLGILSKVKYVVIQSGTSLLENTNTGNYNEHRLKEMVEICKSYGILSKEHNGDYLTTDVIKQKMKHGLDSINIAPEFGMLESMCYIKTINEHNPSLLKEFRNICFDSLKWKKWVSNDFNFNDSERLIKICGHYVLSSEKFISDIKNNLPNIEEQIKLVIKNRIKEICL
jgi:D-tagatose-1,6-bisphosphate aldolase subunit GatZ/KbaZ